MNKPNLIRSMQIPPITMHKYERYLPNAFDESLSILEKINKIIQFSHEIAELSDTMLGRWNEVYNWVMNEGLDNAVGDRLMEWIENGTFDKIINETIFQGLNERITDMEEFIDTSFKEMRESLNETIKELTETINISFETLKNDMLTTVNSELFNLGSTIFEWSE